MPLEPSPVWNWMAVSWGGPDEVVAGDCSYCETALRCDEMPLILWDDKGWTARFCEACQRQYWGLR